MKTGGGEGLLTECVALAALYRGLEHPWILILAGALEPIPRGLKIYRGCKFIVVFQLCGGRRVGTSNCG